MNTRRRYLLRFTLLALVISYFYSTSVINPAHLTLVDETDTYYIKGQYTEIKTDLQKDEYLLKLKYLLTDNPLKEVYLNKERLQPHLIKEDGELEKHYYVLPKEKVIAGKNIFGIEFSHDTDISLSLFLQIKNHRKPIEELFFVVFNNSLNVPLHSLPVTILLSILGTILIVSGALLIIHLLDRYTFLNYKKACQVLLIVLLCPFIFLFIVKGASLITQWRASTPDYHIYINGFSFWMFVIIVCGFVCAAILFSYLWGGVVYLSTRKSKVALEATRDSEFFFLKKLLQEIFQWIRHQPFSGKLIIAFMFCLYLSNSLLRWRVESLGSSFANIAYVLLLMGLIIKGIRALRRERNTS